MPALKSHVLQVAFAVALMSVSPALSQTAPPEVVSRIEADIPDSIVSQFSPKRPMRALMQTDQVPAISVAVFKNGTLEWAHAWGVADVDTGAAATPATLFQAASITRSAPATT